jgi:hypothetical protein
MNVRLDHNFTGLSSDLFFLADGTVQRSGSVDSYIDYSGSAGVNCLADLLELTPPALISPAMSKALATSGIGDQMLSYYMEPADFKASLFRVQEFCGKVFSAFEDSSYPKRYLQNLAFMNSMKPAKIDASKLNSCEEIKSANALESFSSDFRGFMDPVRYSLTNSITGRSSVISGPQILTTAKVVRSFLRSRYSDGKILEIDFSSLEPRVALAIAKMPGDSGDVYDQVNREILGGQLNREIAKVATLSAMYGASERLLAESLPEHIKPKKVIESIRSRIGFDQTIKKIKADIETHGRFTNQFGRPIIAPKGRAVRDPVLFNWLIQSSAVDVAIAGFRHFTTRLRGLGVEFEPIFVIHDAILIDVRSSQVKTVETALSGGYEMEGFGKFPVKVRAVE